MWPLEKNAVPPDGHVFQATEIFFEFFLDINGTNLLTKFHDDQTINVFVKPYKEKCPAPGGHVFQPTRTIFKLVYDIIKTNVLTKFHEDWHINESLRVKNAPPLAAMLFQPTGTIFELTINVASRVLTRFYYRKNSPPPPPRAMQMLTPHDARRTKGDYKSSP
ncbi:hypothetical protein DPMN_103295 [Dreissena polymorpha]|uniref:Uncharacterized protein n=1 Tax=Dreissena polymorpha TaxID=45954 RepID=A0A9D4K2L2_DREPO|nr:hypothetical protein DPMN_103295 [Dreissena polymorpha]